MKYKHRVPKCIREHIEFELRHYKDYKREIAEKEADIMPSITTTWSEAGGGSGVSKPTERAAEKLVTNVFLLETEKLVKSIEKCLNALPEEEKKLVELLYFQNRFTVEGAAQEAGFSKSAAYKKLNDFIYLLACELGYINLE